jgi:hypothetical protein
MKLFNSKKDVKTRMFSNRKGFITKTGIVVGLTVFYSTLFILVGYINSYFISQSGITKQNVNTSSFFSFIGTIITGITSLPWWINTIIFGSFLIIVSWIIFSSLPTFNGGS